MIDDKIEDCQDANLALLEEMQRLHNDAIIFNTGQAKFLEKYSHIIKCYLEFLTEHEDDFVFIADSVQK